jgi:osmotically-inducible protein OsmY
MLRPPYNSADGTRRFPKHLIQGILQANAKENQLKRSKLRNALTFTVVLITASGCAAIQTYRKCAAGGCPDDSRITAELRSWLNQRPDLGAAQVYVQTLDNVVCLSGQVTTVLQRDAVESMAREVPGVRGVNDNVVAIADSGL